MSDYATGYQRFKNGHKIPAGADHDFIEGWYAAKDAGEKFGDYDSPFSAPDHGERPGCEGVALPYDLQEGATAEDLFNHAASWDGGAVPAKTIDRVEQGLCPDCATPVIFITTI